MPKQQLSAKDRATIKQVEPFFLSIKDAAEFLGLEPKTLRNKISARTWPLKVYRIGTKPVFLLTDLQWYAQAIVDGTDV